MGNVRPIRKPLIAQKTNFTFNYRGIPEEMKQYDQWVVWSLVKESKEDDKPKKIPVYLKNGQLFPSSWKNIEKLKSFKEALKILNSSKKFHGLGFVLTEDDPFLFVDYDNLNIETKTEDARYSDLMTKGTYYEISQSQNGLHFILHSTKQIGPIIEKESKGIEIYQKGRFIAMTGIIETDKPLPILEDDGFYERAKRYIETGEKPTDLFSPIDESDVYQNYQIPKHIPAGQRDNEITRYAGYLSFKVINGDLTEDQAESLMLHFLTHVIEQPDDDIYPLMVGMEKLPRAIKDAKKKKLRLQKKNQCYVNQYVFIKKEDKYYDLMAHISLSKSALNESYIRTHTGKKGGLPKMVTLLGQHPDRKIADDYTWLPSPHGSEEHILIKDGGTTYVNTWKGFAVSPIEGDISQWLKLVEFLLPNEKERNIYIDRLAFDIQHPDRKCNWHPLFVGRRGVGKDLVVAPMLRVFGESAGSLTNQEVQSDYHDALVKKKFLIYSEVKGLRGQSLEFMKEATTNGNTKMLMNIKYGGQILQPALWSFQFNTNHYDAIELDKNERRFFCFEKIEALKDHFSSEEIEKMANQIKYDDDFPSAFMYYMLQRDLSKFNPNELPYHTPTFHKMTSASQSDMEINLDEFFEQHVEKDNLRFLEPGELVTIMRVENHWSHLSKKRLINELFQRDWIYLRDYIDGRIAKKVDGKTLTKSRSYLIRRDDTDLLKLTNSEIYDLIDKQEKRIKTDESF